MQAAADHVAKVTRTSQKLQAWKQQISPKDRSADCRELRYTFYALLTHLQAIGPVRASDLRARAVVT